MEENSIVKPPKKKSIWKTILFGFLCFLLLFYGYIRLIEPKEIIVKEEMIVDEALPYSFHGLKLVQFSDLLYGTTFNEQSLKKLVKKINELNPDIIIFNGDLLNSSLYLNEQDKTTLKEELKKLKASFKKYAVLGDQDYTDKNSVLEIMDEADFLVLNNKNDSLYYKENEPIVFMGTTSLLEKEYNLLDASTTENNTSYKIWISHEPIIFDALEQNNIKPNIIFTGHTLNGLIKLPSGYLLRQEGIDAYTDHFYQKDNVKMYTTSGLGTYKYPVRFLNPPTIHFYRFYQY